MMLEDLYRPSKRRMEGEYVLLGTVQVISGLPSG
jgi:hypothetical protein